MADVPFDHNGVPASGGGSISSFSERFSRRARSIHDANGD